MPWGRRPVWHTDSTTHRVQPFNGIHELFKLEVTQRWPAHEHSNSRQPKTPPPKKRQSDVKTSA